MYTRRFFSLPAQGIFGGFDPERLYELHQSEIVQGICLCRGHGPTYPESDPCVDYGHVFLTGGAETLSTRHNTVMVICPVRNEERPNTIMNNNDNGGVLVASARLVQVTPEAERMMAYIARVSNPDNQENATFAGLLRYCLGHGHWSVFEQAYMTVEVDTSVAIATQILRHRSFTFQQFSQRYARLEDIVRDRDDDAGDVTDGEDHMRKLLPLFQLRSQDLKNRQNSIDDIDPDIAQDLARSIRAHFDATAALYKRLLAAGVAKECARFVLPQSARTRLYMTGSCRSFVHYLQMRTANGTQREHMDVAMAIRDIFCDAFPTVAKALGWDPSPYSRTLTEPPQ